MRVVERSTSDDPKDLVVEQHPGPGCVPRARTTPWRSSCRGGRRRCRSPTSPVSRQPTRRPRSRPRRFVVAVERRHDENVPRDVVLEHGPCRRRPSAARVDGDAGRERRARAGAGARGRRARVRRGRSRAPGEAARARAAGGVQRHRRAGQGDRHRAGGRAARAARLRGRHRREPRTGDHQGPERDAARPSRPRARRCEPRALVPDVQNYSPGARVRAQDPSGGAEARRGSKITLFL